MDNQDPLMVALEEHRVPDQPTPARIEEPATTAPVIADTPTHPIPVEPTPTPEPDYNAWVREKTAGKFEKWEDLEAAINKPVEAPPQIEFANDVSKTLHEALVSGNIKEVADYIKKSEIAASIKDKSPEDLIKAKWKLEYDLTDQQAEREFQRKFSVDELLDPEDLEIEKKKVARGIQEASQDAKQFFTKFEQEIKLPSVNTPAPASAAPTIDMESEQAKSALTFSNHLNQVLPDVSNIPIEFTDPNANINLKGQVVIPSEKLQSIQTQLNGHEDKFIQSRWFDKDGNFNAPLFARDVYVITHTPDLFKAAAADIYHQTRIETRKQQVNYVPNQPTPTADATPSESEQLVSWFNSTFKVPA